MRSRAAVADAADGEPQVRPDTFASLRIRNFRLAGGLLVSSTGGWVQRIAQDWLVLDLTGSATAVGITTACQFLPTLAIGLLGGMIADRFPRRVVLLVTQSTLGALAAVLSALTLTDRVTGSARTCSRSGSAPWQRSTTHAGRRSNELVGPDGSATRSGWCRPRSSSAPWPDHCSPVR